MKKNIQTLSSALINLLSLPFEHPWLALFIIAVIYNFSVCSKTDPPEPKLYTATLYIEGNKSIPCIVRVEKYVDRYEERNGRTHTDLWYEITEINLPYGITEYPEDETYNTTSARNTIDPSGWGDYCDIEINMEHEATSNDWDDVNSTVVYSSGEYCVSKQQGTLHFSNCRYAQNIKEENLIYFPSTRIASIFGFTVDDMCSVCAERY